MPEPDVSVVMSVYNGDATLRESLESVLSQAGLRLEVVVVDDGSTDGSRELLARYARTDARLRLVYQAHQGLTAALVRGCAAARAPYIARQDVGDVSLPGRLSRQRDCLAVRPGAVSVSCGTCVVGPGGEHLYEVVPDEAALGTALRSLEPTTLAGPAHHGSVLFRRAAYEALGGYREAFYFAQDLDLWVRLAEIGDHAVVPETLYRAAITPDSISSRYRREQLALTRLIVASATLRRAGASDAAVLARAAAIRPTRFSRSGRRTRAGALYFVGACLARRGDRTATTYLRRAIGENPLHLRAWYRLLTAR